MKYIGESAFRKLISLIKGDLSTKQPTITASGLLKGDGTGTITAADTQEAALVDVPNGLLKGDGTTISAAVAGTDYMTPASNQFTASAGQVLTKTSTGTEWTTIQSGGDSPPIEVDLSDSITMDESCLWTTLLNLSSDSTAAMKIKQAALAGNAKVTVKIKVSSSSEPERVTLRMVGSQYTDAELGERYNLTGTAVLSGAFPIDVILGAYGGDPPTYVLGGLAPQGRSEPLPEVDLSDNITLSLDNLFVSSASLGNNKSIGERIKQAALERSANVTVMFKSKDGTLEKVTLQMFGTQSAAEDRTPTYALTGTYVFSGVLPIDIMIGTIIYETDCTVVKRIDSAGNKPIYDPVDKPDTTPDGAFLRWSSEQKKWVAETVPAAEGGTF